MRAETESKQATAAAVWRLLLRCAMNQFGRSSEIVQRFGLTPGHTKALLVLDPEQALPMGNLAQLFGCDASTVTWLVDRLEERGLVERRGLRSDRRVKTVALTDLGVRTKRELEQHLYQPPDQLLALDGEVLIQLHSTLADMTDAPAQT